MNGKPYSTDEVQCSALYQLLENLLEWSSIRRGKFIFLRRLYRSCIVVNSVMDFHTEQLRKKEIQLQVSIPEDMHLQADLHAFSSILRNLLHNAIKFTPKGGPGQYRVEKTEAGGTRYIFRIVV
jgi:signal transduction histidine kinase